MSNPWDKQKWGVLVCGPDNALAAESFDEAVKRANDINLAMIHLKNGELFESVSKNGEESYPISPVLFSICWAKVSIWESISRANHDPEKTDWDNACS